MPRSKPHPRPAGKAMPQFPFTPVALTARHDGWTAERQIAFINALAEGVRRIAMLEDAFRTAQAEKAAAARLEEDAG
ncbi:MAG: hypothetical protein U1E68_10885 [Sphingomonadaceae bacterium]